MSRRNVAYTKPDEPNFIKALKSKVGYKEPSTVGRISVVIRTNLNSSDVTLQILRKKYLNVPLGRAVMMKR